ncbi:TetR/AcrR family transcriptional regulator [Kribbella sp. NPDC056345]|uniref:TetR/AcrR family transcriptional regulator n=1 Tax=Kribbella sp. NPDC056345 TaxID=3345789 RepID=UPI0035DB1486
MSTDNRLTARQAAAEQTKQKLLAAAVAEFSQRPYDEVTVGGIARAAGVAHGLVSHHFQGKQGAYVAAVDAVYRQMEAAESSELVVDAVGDRLRQRFRRFLAFVAANPDTALNLILASGRDEAFAARREYSISVVTGWLDLPTGNAAVTVALAAFADAAEGLAAEWLRGGRATSPPTDTAPFSVEAMTEAFLALLAGALRSAQALDPSLDVRPALALL